MKDYLKMEYRFTNAEGSWIFTEPRVEGWSVQWLFTWLDRACRGDLADDEQELAFSRGLSFRWVEDEAGREVLRVLVNNEYFDPWSEYKTLGADFPCVETDLAAAAAELRKQYQEAFGSRREF